MVAERHFRACGEVRWVVGVSAAPVVYFRYFGATVLHRRKRTDSLRLVLPQGRNHEDWARETPCPAAVPGLGRHWPLPGQTAFRGDSSTRTDSRASVCTPQSRRRQDVSPWFGQRRRSASSRIPTRTCCSSFNPPSSTGVFGGWRRTNPLRREGNKNPVALVLANAIARLTNATERSTSLRRTDQTMLSFSKTIGVP